MLKVLSKLYFFLQKPFVIMAGEWWEVALNVSSIKKKYGTGPSGLWSPSGSDGASSVGSNSVQLEFRGTDRDSPHWRSSVTEGQMPYLLFWKL